MGRVFALGNVKLADFDARKLIGNILQHNLY